MNAPDSTDRVFIGKYAGLRDSLLHWLCNAGWGNESDGNSPEYGSYFTRISLTWDDVRPSNTEFSSLLEEWAREEEHDLSWDGTIRLNIVGHWIVSEDSNGFVHVLDFPTEPAAKARFRQFAEHYASWSAESGDDN